MSCQHALFLFRWLDRPPEDFIARSTIGAKDPTIAKTDSNHRLRWNLAELHAELNSQRQQHGLTWRDLAELLDCTPSRLMNLKRAKLADLALVMSVTQWLERPASNFIYPADHGASS